MLPDGFAEGFPFLGVFHGVVECGLADAECTRSDLDAADFETAHHVCPAAVRGAAEHGVTGHVVFFEDDFAGFDAAVAEFGELLGDGHAVAGFDEQDAHPAVRGEESRSVMQSRPINPECAALEIHVFDPVIDHLSPSGSA